MANSSAVEADGVRGLLCLDVDGTLVTRDGDVYPAAVYLVEVAAKLGFAVALCSARSVQGLMPVIDQLPGVSFAAGLGGAVVSSVAHPTMRRDGPTIIYESDPLAIETCRLVVEAVSEHEGLELWGFSASQWFVLAQSGRVAREAAITGQVPVPSNIDALVRPDLHKLVMPEVGLQTLDTIERRIGVGAVSLVYSTDLQVEINTPAVRDKGVGALRSAISAEAPTVVALGDGANDAGMLEAADVGVTFSDGHSSLYEQSALVLPAERNSALSELASYLKEVVG